MFLLAFIGALKIFVSQNLNMKEFIFSHYQKIKNLYLRYERILMPATLVVGFLVDYFTFTNIQIVITFIALFVYWVLAGAIIIFIHSYDAQRPSALSALKYVRLLAPLVLQFTFGALLGASLVFYWFSGAFSASWPIMAIVVALMIFNDTFRHYFEKSFIQISVYFFATISLFSLALPFLFKSLSAWMFVVAGAASVVLFLSGIQITSLWISSVQKEKRRLFSAVVAITVIMNALYFADIIPPIPLSLREAGLYHNIRSFNGKYVMRGEKENFLQKSVFGQTLHIQSSERVYLYTAIFAPADLKTDIIHRWQYYDEEREKWIDKGLLSFAINGGRKEGYKGYSWQSDLAAGKWRVSVENHRGQALGKVRFTVERTGAQVELQEIVR